MALAGSGLGRSSMILTLDGYSLRIFLGHARSVKAMGVRFRPEGERARRPGLRNTPSTSQDQAEDESRSRTQSGRPCLAQKKRYAEHAPNPDDITIADAVEWIARMGGATGESSGGPPGFKTLQRGLARLEPFVEGLACGMAAS